jgi:hypothetical protein
VNRSKTVKSKKVKILKQDKQELYGFDIDFLKELDLGDMIDDLSKDKGPIIVNKNENKNMEQL